MTITEKYTPAAQSSIKCNGTYLDSKGDIAIPHDLKDLSTYSKFLALYTRDRQSSAYKSIEEKQDFNVKSQWTSFIQLISEFEPVKASVSDSITEYHIPSDIADKYTGGLSIPIKISEYCKESEHQVRGCVTTIENENEFNDWFIFHILDQARLGLSEKKVCETGKPYHEIFSDYFEKKLKNTIKDDKWDAQGREYFTKRVKYFTDRYTTIECVLPAFPCKSSNIDKVVDESPDKGEELALKRLIKATIEVGKIYPPGMKIWIISDGHVFSDCIGVDDDVVNSYTVKLHQLYEKIAVPGVDAIGFCGLNDLFFNGAAASSFNPQMIEDIVVDHFTGSKICALSDVSRAILMKGCDTDDGRLRKQISIDGHPRLNLYRGFSRFMSEDLALLPNFQAASKKSFKKIVSKIAFNMIKRNDAYSNLVELVFPHHMRLSIHAHTNSGPKFGVKVISMEQCMIVKSLNSGQEPKFEDLLHIPTPWHNCVALLDNNQYVLTKSKIVKEAILNGTYEGEWQNTCLDTGEGGFYVIKKRKEMNDF
ncbi:hypothetical protein HG535_0D04600 [Zygotorulaspora mrakii]|uniref:Spore wall maturation protein DIT1 n=1 Tax=Zygotorulaspora mrakii TaxID=42260 RepID=A0A7H9B271_ZYGMR|nr:uncharacterized protein HG535_0D04600 [Zygotorulaspora mrakii]QLG72751.1 hypothetical protein HG535_0D04600 [Zygotorulaspora mrakii]